MHVFPLDLPLTHPAYMLADSAADERTTSMFRPSLYRRARSLVFRLRHKVRHAPSATTRSGVGLLTAARRGDLSRVAAPRADSE
jgi:hypothetical protein